MKPYAKKFYKSAAWKKCRNSYFSSKYGLCERCAGTGKIVHHIKYITPENIDDPAITLSHSNLELLCQDCHNREHHEKNGVTAAGLHFDDEGNLVRG
ncbi:HNH endonuclease [Bacillus sp. PAMC26568]|nr:HNH endonuclease [Bacillus sp. PAMC26568]